MVYLWLQSALLCSTDSTVAASTRPQVLIHDKHTLRVDWTSPTTSTEEAIVYNVFWTDYQHDDGWEHLEMVITSSLIYTHPSNITFSISCSF